MTTFIFIFVTFTLCVSLNIQISRIETFLLESQPAQPEYCFYKFFKILVILSINNVLIKKFFFIKKMCVVNPRIFSKQITCPAGNILN